jgi:hypothetical protein
MHKNLILISYLVVYLYKRGGYMEEKVISSRSDVLEEMISDAQKMPGLIELMAVYGELDKLMLKSKEYLAVYTTKTISSLSSSSS